MELAIGCDTLFSRSALARCKYYKPLVGSQYTRDGKLPFRQILWIITQMPTIQIYVRWAAIGDFEPVRIVVVVIEQSERVAGHQLADHHIRVEHQTRLERLERWGASDPPPLCVARKLRWREVPKSAMPESEPFHECVSAD